VNTYQHNTKSWYMDWVGSHLLSEFNYGCIARAHDDIIVIAANNDDVIMHSCCIGTLQKTNCCFSKLFG